MVYCVSPSLISLSVFLTENKFGSLKNALTKKKNTNTKVSDCCLTITQLKMDFICKLAKAIMYKDNNKKATRRKSNIVPLSGTGIQKTILDTHIDLLVRHKAHSYVRRLLSEASWTRRQTGRSTARSSHYKPGRYWLIASSVPRPASGDGCGDGSPVNAVLPPAASSPHVPDSSPLAPPEGTRGLGVAAPP